MPELNNILKAPFAEQLDYFRGKLNLPTERWDDILGAAHDRAFIVAGAMKADLLGDLRQAVDKAIAQGTGLEAFRKDFAKIVQKHGWDYNGAFDWRTRVIYQTNLSTSYAAGRWAQLNDPDLVKLRPYWKYVHSDGVANPRPLHVAWSGLILERTDPWWQTHFPPNGWGCHCRVVAVSKREYDAAPEDRKAAPDDGSYTKADAFGAEHTIPRGIDHGFAHAPGATWTPDLNKYPYPVARQMVADNMRDGVFERWVGKINDSVTHARALPEMQGLKKDALVPALRKALGAEEAYPVAVLPPEWKDRLNVSTQAVTLSDYDLIKQAVSRDGQDFGALQYLSVQQVIDDARLVVRENEQMTIFVSDATGKWYAAVVQRTQSGKGVFLKSFRRSSEKDARLQYKKGDVLLSDLDSPERTP